MKRFLSFVIVAAALSMTARAQSAPHYTINGKPVDKCQSCAEWSIPHEPVKLFGNTWYVGTRELSAVLITSPGGAVLIDPGLDETVPQLLANIRAVGVDPKSIKLVLTSHVHYDHAGGVASLAKATGARVAALPWSADALERGVMPKDDPQYGIAFDIGKAQNVRRVNSGDTLQIGSITVRAHATPGHTPGSTTWTWQSCDGANCINVVYADSQSAISADGFLFSSLSRYREKVEQGHALLESLPCRLLITPHPSASRLWQRVAATPGASADSLLDNTACKRYAATARAAFNARYEKESKH